MYFQAAIRRAASVSSELITANIFNRLCCGGLNIIFSDWWHHPRATTACLIFHWSTEFRWQDESPSALLL